MRDNARHHALEWLSPAEWTVACDDRAVAGETSVLSRVLRARNLETPEQQEAFLNCSLKDIPDPFLFLDMDRACRIIRAVMERENPSVLIFGDYDADGLTSSALLGRWFKARGVSPELLIPDRFDDGYGLSPDLAQEILLHRPDLVITVDTGTSSPEAVNWLVSRGVEVVVTDHHLPSEDFVRGSVPMINPSIPDETYPYKALSGAGVAYLLTVAMDRCMGELSPVRDTLTVIASVGTIADVMPLTGVNRAIVRAGIALFEEHAPAGLKALHRVAADADSRKSAVTAHEIAFAVAPRLNAAGRMGDVRLALDLLLEEDPRRVVILADKLNELNNERKQAEQDVFTEALADVMNGQGDSPLTVAIARGTGWHAGVLGIVSARLAERLRVPSITLAEDGGILSGSARTFGRINLIEGLTQAAMFLETYGGHAGAAGISLRDENFDRFREAMISYIESIPKKMRQVPLRADTTLEGNAIDESVIECFDALEPMGYGFERPLFLIPRLKIEGIVRVGDGRHLRLRVRARGEKKRLFDAILFHRGEDEVFYSVGDEIDLLAAPEFNIWRDRRFIQLRAKDVRPSGQEASDRDAWRALPEVLRGMPDENLSERLSGQGVAAVSPRVFIALWHLISALAGQERHAFAFSPSRLAWLLTHRYNVTVSALGVLLALALFAEVGLGELAEDEESGYIFRPLETRDEKLKLTKAPLWGKLEALGVLMP